ncbi:SIR2 family protein [Paenibacillus roseipurpureus]|uniref:SIR2 family protein n=1 Tax=Paenibacillus roseopurpureus TaxID=2918901 RepID=A0AA96LPF3_9BACL|nr:SIR2 family protein [Paenibacillus sp. MBLB1832]WNR42490.1 SIR2 family protein [Paenibacillus sp. MBLB1832]
MSYDNYIEELTNDISLCIENMGCQPILFVGSGLSKRYFNGPNWEQLLKEMAALCPRIEADFVYYKQTYRELVTIGKIFSDEFREWAWRDGKSSFPEELFSENAPSDIYIKHKIAEYFGAITPKRLEDITNEQVLREIKLLQEIIPHALITTNYDPFLEIVFPEYTPIIGQKILRTNHASIGEILKIHGCITKPDSLVLTTDDYENFGVKKKYLSAKLLTYFAEHPLLFIGYSAEDSNIKSILSDIDEIISTNNELIPNIYLLEWDKDIEQKALPSREKLVSIDSHRSIRVKSIVADSFEWVFKAFGSQGQLEKVNPKILRSLLSRTYDMVRYDIPKKTVEVNYQALENALNNEGELAKLYGFTTVSDPTALNANYPYNLTQIGECLGYNHWNPANQLLEKIKMEKGVNIKSSDNKYHIRVKIGKSYFSKYSESTIPILKAVKEGQPYSIEI